MPPSAWEAECSIVTKSRLSNRMAPPSHQAAQMSSMCHPCSPCTTQLSTGSRLQQEGPEPCTHTREQKVTQHLLLWRYQGCLLNPIRYILIYYCLEHFRVRTEENGKECSAQTSCSLCTNHIRALSSQETFLEYISFITIKEYFHYYLVFFLI